MQQAAYRLVKETGHDRLPLTCQMVGAKTFGLPQTDWNPDGLLNYEDQTDVQLLQDPRWFYSWYPPDIQQLHQV